MIRKFAPFIFAVAAVAIILFPAVAVGYASTPVSYTAVTTSSSSSITADYFTAGLYTYQGNEAAEYIMDFNNSDFRAVSTAAFNTGRVPYTYDESTYIVTKGSTNTAINDLYVAISSTSHHTKVNDDYTLSYTVSGISESSFTGDATLVWGKTSPPIEVNKAYRLHLGLSNLYYSGEDFPSMTLVVTITITDNNSASYMSAGNNVSFTVQTPMDQVKDQLDGANEDLGDQNMQFYADDNEEPHGVYIQNTGSNTHSIAQADSGFQTIDVDVAIPPGMKVCVYVTIKAARSLILSSDVTVTVTKKTATGTVNYQNVTLESKGLSQLKEYVYLNSAGTKLDHSTSKPTQVARYFQCSDGEELTISFDGDQGWSLFGGNITVTAKLVPYGS